MPDIDDVRLKDLEELDDDDKALLKQHQDDLTDDEKEYYKEAIGEKEPGKKKEGEGEEEEEFKFKTQEELDKYVETKFQELSEKRRAEAREKKKPKEKEEGFFEKDFKPKDWDEYARQLYPKFRDKFQAEIRTADAKDRQYIDEKNKEWDKVLDTIVSKDKDLPKRGTSEFDDLNQKLSSIMVEFKTPDMNKAFEIYSMRNKTQPKKPEGEEEESGAETEERRRELASKVGKGGGTSKPSKPVLYKKFAGRSLDDAFEAAGKRLEELS